MQLWFTPYVSDHVFRKRHLLWWSILSAESLVATTNLGWTILYCFSWCCQIFFHTRTRTATRTGLRLDCDERTSTKRSHLWRQAVPSKCFKQHSPARMVGQQLLQLLQDYYSLMIDVISVTSASQWYQCDDRCEWGTVRLTNWCQYLQHAFRWSSKHLWPTKPHFNIAAASSS